MLQARAATPERRNDFKCFSLLTLSLAWHGHNARPLSPISMDRTSARQIMATRRRCSVRPQGNLRSKFPDTSH